MIPDVSIIVPCYNVAAYVDSCLESLVRQTLRNIEIICINDGSTDETCECLLREPFADLYESSFRGSNSFVELEKVFFHSLVLISESDDPLCFRKAHP